MDPAQRDIGPRTSWLLNKLLPHLPEVTKTYPLILNTTVFFVFYPGYPQKPFSHLEWIQVSLFYISTHIYFLSSTLSQSKQFLAEILLNNEAYRTWVELFIWTYISENVNVLSMLDYEKSNIVDDHRNVLLCPQRKKNTYFLPLAAYGGYFLFI